MTLFKDLDPESAKEAQSSLYNQVKEFNKLSEEVKMTSVGLEDLISQLKKTWLSVENSDSKFNVSKTKKEFDKVAYLINEFIKEFGPIYEQLSALNDLVKLTNDDNETFIFTSTIGVGTINTSSQPFTINGSQTMMGAPVAGTTVLSPGGTLTVVSPSIEQKQEDEGWKNKKE